jgi:DNA polymerase-3 subunit delta
MISPPASPARFSHGNSLPIFTFEQFQRELRSAGPHPVYLLWGPEDLLLRKAISLIRKKTLQCDSPSPFDYSEYSGQSADVDEVLSEAQTFPMMSPMRLVIVTHIDKIDADGQEKICAYAENPQLKTVLILASAALDKRTRVAKQLSRTACAVEFPRLKGAALERWARDLMARRGIGMTPSALGRFMYLAGTDAQSISNEVEKLSLYAGKDEEITDSTVEAVVGASRLHGIFELTSALGARNRKLALQLLDNLLEGGEPPLFILTMMARHFRQIIIAKELIELGRPRAEISRQAQVPEFVLGEFLRHARATPLETARILQERLAGIDLRCKSTNPDEQMLLEHLICSL